MAERKKIANCKFGDTFKGFLCVGSLNIEDKEVIAFDDLETAERHYVNSNATSIETVQEGE